MFSCKFSLLTESVKMSPFLRVKLLDENLAFLALGFLGCFWAYHGEFINHSIGIISSLKVFQKVDGIGIIILSLI